MLSQIVNSPQPGTPRDASALARYELGALKESIDAALRGGEPDLLTRAHLEAMNFDVDRALNSRFVIQQPAS
jgi:hypothetical protein